MFSVYSLYFTTIYLRGFHITYFAGLIDLKEFQQADLSSTPIVILKRIIIYYVIFFGIYESKF